MKVYDFMRAKVIEVPDNEVHYWTPEWQNGEMESSINIDLGQVRTFDDAAMLIAWLRSDGNRNA